MSGPPPPPPPIPPPPRRAHPPAAVPATAMDEVPILAVIERARFDLPTLTEVLQPEFANAHAGTGGKTTLHHLARHGSWMQVAQGRDACGAVWDPWVRTRPSNPGRAVIAAAREAAAREAAAAREPVGGRDFAVLEGGATHGQVREQGQESGTGGSGGGGGCGDDAAASAAAGTANRDGAVDGWVGETSFEIAAEHGSVSVLHELLFPPGGDGDDPYDVVLREGSDGATCAPLPFRLPLVPRVRTMIEVSPGVTMPRLAFGTWSKNLGAADVAANVWRALLLGFRHIDTAPLYGNLREVGAAIRDACSEGGIARDEIFITSKLWSTDHHRVREACAETLEALGVERLDMFLVHAPVAIDADGAVVAHGPEHLRGLWRDMRALVPAGLTRAVGVSNFSPEELAHVPGAAVNQVEHHPALPAERNSSGAPDAPAFADVLLCETGPHPVPCVAHSPLGSPAKRTIDLLFHDAVLRAAQIARISAARALVAWSLAKCSGGCVVAAEGVREIIDDLAAEECAPGQEVGGEHGMREVIAKAHAQMIRIIDTEVDPVSRLVAPKWLYPRPTD